MKKKPLLLFSLISLLSLSSCSNLLNALNGALDGLLPAIGSQIGGDKETEKPGSSYGYGDQTLEPIEPNGKISRIGISFWQLLDFESSIYKLSVNVDGHQLYQYIGNRQFIYYVYDEDWNYESFYTDDFAMKFELPVGLKITIEIVYDTKIIWDADIRHQNPEDGSNLLPIKESFEGGAIFAAYIPDFYSTIEMDITPAPEEEAPVDANVAFKFFLSNVFDSTIERFSLDVKCEPGYDIIYDPYDGGYNLVSQQQTIEHFVDGLDFELLLPIDSIIDIYITLTKEGIVNPYVEYYDNVNGYRNIYFDKNGASLSLNLPINPFDGSIKICMS